MIGSGDPPHRHAAGTRLEPLLVDALVAIAVDHGYRHRRCVQRLFEQLAIPGEIDSNCAGPVTYSRQKLSV